MSKKVDRRPQEGELIKLDFAKHAFRPTECVEPPEKRKRKPPRAPGRVPPATVVPQNEVLNPKSTRKD